MHKLSKILTYCTLAASCFLLIAVGHGISPMIIAEYAVLRGIIAGNNLSKTCFAFNCSYDNSIVVASMVILSGQFVTLVATIYEIVILSVLGILVMLSGFLYLCHNFFIDSLSSFSFFTGMPFFILSIIVLILVPIQTYRSRLKF